MSRLDKTLYEDSVVCIKRLPRHSNLYYLRNKRGLIGIVFFISFKTSDDKFCQNRALNLPNFLVLVFSLIQSHLFHMLFICHYEGTHQAFLNKPPGCKISFIWLSYSIHEKSVQYVKFNSIQKLKSL